MKNKKQYYIFQMNIKTLNVVSIILLILTFVLAYLINKEFLLESIDYLYTDLNFVVFMILYIFYIILHELLHSISYILMGAKFKNIVYGAELEKGVLYCLCKQNISKKNILVSLLTPFTIIGVLTYIISFIINSPYLLFLSIFNISGSAGDIIMFFFISKLKDIEFSEFDEPIPFGLYTEKDILKVKHYGLNYIEKTNNIERKNLIKINISKFSKYFFIGLVLLLIFILLISKN